MALFGKKSDSRPRPPAGPSPGQAAGAPPRPELSGIDFTGGGEIGRGDAGGLEVHEAGSGMSAVAEEAAVLYANGSAQQAELVLSALLESPEGARSGEGVWMMLLDLYRLTDQRQRFEAKVIDYATLFEKSPPPWEDLSNRAARQVQGAPPLVNLAGALSGQATQQFAQMEVIGRKSGALRIDLGKLRSIDEAGCALMWNTVSKLAGQRIKVGFTNAAHGVGLVEGLLEVGKAQCQEGWLLLLELLQHAGEQDRFEQWAVDYAITFEVSPPSWENRGQPGPAVAAVKPAPPAQEPDPSRLEGDLTSASQDVLRRLAAKADEVGSLEVDCTYLRRVDFVSAGTLFNILATLQARGKLVALHNVNAMVGALLRVMGVDQVARVDLRA